ncbi:MAG: T9SS type A sorting domain-containing protein [Bacteroidia bacterium]
MKKFSILTLLFLILVSPLYASHLMGGEITWRCNGNGTYTFKVKIYRDCNGVPAPATLKLISDGPVDTIPCIKISQIDLSPIGVGCPTCASPNLQSSAVEEHIYESDTIALNGVPPITGWNFWYTDCCRNGNIVNLDLTNGYFTLKAKMFSFSGQNASPCYDNSPYFADSPSLAVCNKDTIQFNHTAFDVELDSLSFSWTPPLSTDINTNAVFNSPYTHQNPLPGPAQNPQNTVATLDSSQGIISFYSNSIGSYVTANKVSAYKCGQLVAEIFREVQVYLTNCQISSNPPAFNSAPDVYPSSDVETFNIIAGDSFIYNFISFDFELLPNGAGGNVQTLTLNAIGIELGLGDTSFTTGCLIPPCAVLQLPTPIDGPAQISNKLTWPTTCAHAGFTNGCIQSQRTFQFILKVEDNFCPAHGVRYKNILVNVQGPQIYSSGNDLAVSYPGVTLQWYFNGVPIPGATDTIYTPTVAGIYSVMATTGSGCIMLSNSVNKTFTGIETLKSKESSIQVFPNPSTGNTTLNVLLNNMPTGSNLIRVFDVNGKVVKQIPIVVYTTDEHLLIDLSDLSSGVYSLNISGEGKIHQTQLVLTN